MIGCNCSSALVKDGFIEQFFVLLHAQGDVLQVLRMAFKLYQKGLVLNMLNESSNFISSYLFVK